MLKLTPQAIRNWAGDTIFERGEAYQRQGLVSDLQFDAADQTLKANVEGNYGEYEVSVSLKKTQLEAECDCPYEGWPCKHMVAVVLTFLADKPRYLQAAQKATATQAQLIDKLHTLSADQLLALVLEAQAKYPEFRRDLLLKLENDNPNTLKTIKKELKQALAKIGRGSSITQASRQVEQIWQSAATATPAVQLAVLLEILEQGLVVLSAFEIYDTDLDELLAECLEDLETLFEKHTDLAADKEKALSLLMHHYHKGNTLEDNLYETVEALADNPAHYRLVLASLQQQATKPRAFSSYLTTQMATWHARLGNDEERLALLSKDLSYGMDYWRLAEYWLEKKQPDKAWQVVQQGLKQGQGRKDELYNYALTQLQGDIPAQAKLFEQWLADHSHRGSEAIEANALYQSLCKHYARSKDPQALEALFLSRLKHQQLDLKLYHSAKEQLAKATFARFETKLIASLTKLAAKPKSAWDMGLSSAEKLLGQIWELKGETAKLWKMVKAHPAGRAEFEKTLLPHYPDAYLKAWQQDVKRYIDQRNRSAYKEAVKLLKKMKPIRVKQLKDPAGWKTYLQGLRQNHPTLKALQDELNKAGF